MFAGDWVQPDDGAWYMERAVRTGRLAAREVAREAGADPERVPLVAPVREAWNVRSILGEAEGLGGFAPRARTSCTVMFGYHDAP